MHPLQLALSANKDTLSIGEEVELTIQWKNIGDKPFHVFKRIIYSTDLVKASDIHGEELEHFLNVLMELRPLTIDDYKLLKPGEMYVKKLMAKFQISETRPKEHVLNFGNSEYRLGNNKKIFLRAFYELKDSSYEKDKDRHWVWKKLPTANMETTYSNPVSLNLRYSE